MVATDIPIAEAGAATAAHALATTGVAMAPKTLSFEHPGSIVYPI